MFIVIQFSCCNSIFCNHACCIGIYVLVVCMHGLFACSYIIARGVGRGGSKGSDKPPFNPEFILKIANYLSNLNTKSFQV